MNTPSSASPLTIFCGKGGVGKTSLALAFALRHAEQGKSVLVVTSHPIRELAVAVSLAGLKQKHPAAAANLFVVHLDPLEILAAKVRQVVPSETLAKRVLASPIYKSLIEVAPGLKEMAFLGRLHQIARERRGEGAAKFDLLVWDAPATGHFIQTLQVSQRFETYLSGPFALLGKEVAEFFQDASNLTVIPIATLEDMAVEETIEMCATLAGELHLRPSAVICNLASPLLAQPETEFETLRDKVEKKVEDTAAGDAGLRFIFERQEIERALYRKLRSSVLTKLHIVERCASWNSDLELLWDLSRQLGGIAGELIP